MHTLVRACVATPVTSLCTFVNMCVHVVVVATYVCVFCLCVLTCLCVFKGVNHTYIRTGAFVHMRVLWAFNRVHAVCYSATRNGYGATL